MDKEEFEETLTTFIARVCRESNLNVEITADTRLFKDRLINSVRIIDIMSFVERELNIQIPEEKLTMNYFETPRKITESFWANNSEQKENVSVVGNANR